MVFAKRGLLYGDGKETFYGYIRLLKVGKIVQVVSVQVVVQGGVSFGAVYGRGVLVHASFERVLRFADVLLGAEFALNEIYHVFRGTV